MNIKAELKKLIDEFDNVEDYCTLSILYAFILKQLNRKGKGAAV